MGEVQPRWVRSRDKPSDTHKSMFADPYATNKWWGVTKLFRVSNNLF